MKKVNIYTIIEFLFIFLIILITNLYINTVDLDEIWNYGFSYNIATGLIPYKDFNMVIFPFFPIVNAIIMTIFGKNLLVFHIFNAIICTTIFYLIKKLLPNYRYLIYIILIPMTIPNYNTMCLLFVLLIVYLENSKKGHNYLIGLLVGLTITTKQNIGLLLTIPCFYLAHSNHQKILKRLLGIIFPIIAMLIYLHVNDSLSEWLNYTILGLADFQRKNSPLSTYYLSVAINIIYILYRIIKFKDHSPLPYYALFFLFINYPLANFAHYTFSIIPFIIYILKNLPLKPHPKIWRIMFTAMIPITLTIRVLNVEDNNINFPNNTTTYKCRVITKEPEQSTLSIASYLKSIPQDTYLFLLDSEAYLYKLEAQLPINKYDLINNGNMGKNGAKVYIKEINNTCSKNKCLFLIDKKKLKANNKDQTNKEILKYITNNYEYQDNIDHLSIYKNLVKNELQ